MQYNTGSSDLVSVKIDGKYVASTLKAIEKKWQEMIPNRPFEYYFADEYFNRQYKSENRFGSIFLNFAVLAIIISCLGLFGLVSYNTTQRYREIGVRKVLGSSITGIVKLLSADFIKLVVISILIATPITWFFMYKWLDNFAYHISLSWWFFAVAGMIAIFIALAVISSLTVRAARENPIRSLRNE
ncbi:putative ABC transport system permease protein [bacterium A37T11]|nr:putative ABC transport system permease protein [bacterium A37T11]